MNKKLLIALGVAALFVSSNAQPFGEENGEVAENGENGENTLPPVEESTEEANPPAEETEIIPPVEEATTPNEEATPSEEATPNEEASGNEENTIPEEEEGTGPVDPGFLGGKLLATSAGALMAVVALFAL